MCEFNTIHAVISDPWTTYFRSWYSLSRLNLSGFGHPRQHHSPMIALLTRETLQMVHIRSCSHHHLECRNHLVACRTVARIAEQPQIVPLAQQQIRFRVQRAAHLAQSAIAASALQTILMPEHVQRSQQIPIDDALAATGALVRCSTVATVGRRHGRVDRCHDRLRFDAIRSHVGVVGVVVVGVAVVVVVVAKGNGVTSTNVEAVWLWPKRVGTVDSNEGKICVDCCWRKKTYHSY